MTPDEWKDVEAQLSGVYGQVELLVDGYSLTLEVRWVALLRMTIVPFVNGWMRGEWSGKDCEERRRFLRPRVIQLWKPSTRARLTNGFSKRDIKRMFPDMDKTLTVYYSTWPSFGPLKRHLIKHNQSIELKPKVKA